jgi:flagellar biosynthesis/type III secretory pathway chaperone
MVQKPLTLTRLAAHVQPPYDQRLRDVQTALTRVVESVQHANAESRMIFTHCQKWVRNTLGFFEHWMKSTDLYGATGSLRSRSGSGRLVSGNV